MAHLLKTNRIVALAITAVILAGCGGNKTAEKIAKDRNFTPDVVNAMNSCLSTSHNRRILFKNGKKQLMLAKPPAEFCACQAPVMAQVLTEEGYAEADKVLAMFGPTPEKLEMDPAALKEGVLPVAARSRLEGSVKSCAIRAKEELARKKAENKKKKKSA